MTDDALAGRSVEVADRADAHRRAAYDRFFALAAGQPALAFHWLLFSALPAETREDGHARVMAPFPPLPYPRRMWAGGEVRWIAPIAADEPLVRTTRVTRADAKSGGAGDFLLTSLDHRIAGADGVRIEERQDVVFLPAATRPGSAPPRPPAFAPDWSEERCFGPVDLFRYSALTLNSHRIHYDAEYAREVEHYPGLVVHGPLLATHMIHAAARRHPAATPRSFAYRAVAPVFADETIRLIGHLDGTTQEVAVVGADGGVRTTGTMMFG